MSIQGSINSMLGSVTHGVLAIKGYQELKSKNSPQLAAAQLAQQSSQNEADAKKMQKEQFEAMRNSLSNMSIAERAEILKEGSHIQAQAKRMNKEAK